MTPTWESRVVSRIAAGRPRVRVRRAPTTATLGGPADRGARATVAARRHSVAVAAALALAFAHLAGCEPELKGSGVLAEETPPVAGSFEGLRVEDRFAAFVTVGSGEAQTVRVLGDSNVVPGIEASLETVTVGSTAVTVLHVWRSGDVTPVIRPSVVVTVPALRYVEARGDASVQLRRPAASAEVCPALAAVLQDADLDATAGSDYVTDGAAVTLGGRSEARLHSDGPVRGSVSAQSTLENAGTGSCAGVDAEPGARVSCPR